MEIVKIIGIAFVTTFASVLLKQTKPELSFAVTITGVIVLLMFILDSLQGTIAAISLLAETTGMENGLLKSLLKIIGVGYVTEFGAGILKDFGSHSIADKVELGGKLTIVLLSMPILEGLLQLVRGFLQLA